jgi:vancomycin resistance protein VanJ
MMKSVAQKLMGWLVALGWVYFTYLFGWLGVYLLTGDHWWRVAMLTALAHHVFWPLPLVIGLAALTRRRSLWVGSGVAIVAWVALFGGLFNFRLSAPPDSASTFRVLTYNVASWNDNAETVAAIIRAADADVVALQELGPNLADPLGPELAEEYPYQLLKPEPIVTGMGLLSRYPIEPVATEEAFWGEWVGDPQAVIVELPGGPVTVLNAHFVRGRGREANASQVAEWTAAQPESVIVMGDLNATDLSDAYGTLVDGGLRDTWREVGWGYGGTFPASPTLGYIAKRPVRIVPARMARIDFILHTTDLTAHSVERLPWDGRSDHLPVVAEFARAGE